MNQLLVRQAINHAVKMCDKYDNRVVITINGTGGLGDSTEIRPYKGVDFCFDPDLDAIIIKGKDDGRSYIDTNRIKAIYCYKQNI